MFGKEEESGDGMKIELTDTELILLDGKVSPDAQKEIELAKQRIALVGFSKGQQAFLVAVKNEAETNGILGCRYVRVAYCKICKRDPGYAKYKSSTQYHKKGDLNRKKPLSFQGIDLALRFVTMTGYPTLGCCSDCWKEIQPAVTEILKDVQAEIPKGITGTPSRYKKVFIMACECGWKGLETEMGELPAVMGGKYKGKCPSCGFENRFLGPHRIRRVHPEEWALVEMVTA